MHASLVGIEGQLFLIYAQHLLVVPPKLCCFIHVLLMLFSLIPLAVWLVLCLSHLSCLWFLRVSPSYLINCVMGCIGLCFITEIGFMGRCRNS